MMTDNTDERLAKIETMLGHLTEKIEDRMVQSDRWRNRMETTVYGDGNGSPGHHIKLDRLLQSQERQKWLVRTLVAAVIALALPAVQAALA